MDNKGLRAVVAMAGLSMIGMSAGDIRHTERPPLPPHPGAKDRRKKRKAQKLARKRNRR